MKFFHELTKAEFHKLIDSKITYKELDRIHPQPTWCTLPEATHGYVGCWSLVGFKVTGEGFCKNCNMYKSTVTEDK